MARDLVIIYSWGFADASLETFISVLLSALANGPMGQHRVVAQHARNLSNPTQVCAASRHSKRNKETEKQFYGCYTPVLCGSSTAEIYPIVFYHVPKPNLGQNLGMTALYDQQGLIWLGLASHK